MGGHERGDRLGAQQRGVAGEHEDVAVLLVEVVVGEDGQPDAGRVTGAALHVLLDEVEHEVGGFLLQLLGDPLRAVADHDDRPAGVALGQRIEHVEQHGPPAQQVEGLRAGRAHAGALSSGEDDGGQGALGHASVLTRPVGLGH